MLYWQKYFVHITGRSLTFMYFVGSKNLVVGFTGIMNQPNPFRAETDNAATPPPQSAEPPGTCHNTTVLQFPGLLVRGSCWVLFDFNVRHSWHQFVFLTVLAGLAARVTCTNRLVQLPAQPSPALDLNQFGLTEWKIVYKLYIKSGRDQSSVKL